MKQDIKMFNSPSLKKSWIRKSSSLNKNIRDWRQNKAANMTDLS